MVRNACDGRMGHDLSFGYQGWPSQDRFWGMEEACIMGFIGVLGELKLVVDRGRIVFQRP